MTRDELIRHLTTVLGQAADGPPPGPRPAGDFVGNPPRGAAHGLVLTAPGGETFYLAVLEAKAFERNTGADDVDDRLAAVVATATNLLASRRDQMETVEEWVDLARAVAACTARKTADLLTERDLEQVTEDPPLPWAEATDGLLPRDDGAGGFEKEG